MHKAQLMSLPLTVSCVSKIQIGFTLRVPAHLGSPGKRAIKRGCVCMGYLYLLFTTGHERCGLWLLVLQQLVTVCGSSGQQLAQQMQQSNPELVEQLRSQMRGQSNAASSDSANTDDQSPRGNLGLLLL